MFINQQQNGGKWNSPGRLFTGRRAELHGHHYLTAGSVKHLCGRGEVHLFGGGGGNLPPTARNDSVATTMNTEVTVYVSIQRHG